MAGSRTPPPAPRRPGFIARLADATGWADDDIAAAIGRSKPGVYLMRVGQRSEYLTKAEMTALRRLLLALRDQLDELIFESELTGLDQKPKRGLGS
jgi:hypothetical protein